MDSAHLAPTSPTLKVLIAGGGPVGMLFALMLRERFGRLIDIKIFDQRWCTTSSPIRWKEEHERNARRQQVVTIQSRQWTKFPKAVQEGLFKPGTFSEMWPVGADSVGDLPPRNVRISFIEDTLLEICRSQPDVTLVPAPFDPLLQEDEIRESHLLVIAEGAASRTRNHFISRFGEASKSMYSLAGEQVSDVVLGLRVKSRLDPAQAVVLTVAQNRFLLNSLNGEGFLNIRLTPEEKKEVVGVVYDAQNPGHFHTVACIQSSPCLMEPDSEGAYRCQTHGSLFAPALFKKSKLWNRIEAALDLFKVEKHDLTAITAFQLAMEHRPRFTIPLHEPAGEAPGTMACLIGDAANAIHFWPGRGLNSGIASAYSLAISVARAWNGTGFRDADFSRHEAVMALLQYRHKTRAWRQMVAFDSAGNCRAIHDVIADAIRAPDANKQMPGPELLARMKAIRDRLKSRLANLPTDAQLGQLLQTVDAETLRVMVASGPWETARSGGDEVDVDALLGVAAGGQSPAAPRPRKEPPVPTDVPSPEAGLASPRTSVDVPPRSTTARWRRRSAGRAFLAAILVLLLVTAATSVVLLKPHWIPW